MIPEIGRKFGPYEVLGRLGGGGMGHVFRAWDARLHREVAIKFLHNEYSMPGMRERFLREARAASALNHPNICTVFDIGEQDGDPYLVMELLQGETLKDRIDQRSIQVEELLCLGKEVAEALGAAHSKGVIHRDIKPANIFLVTKPHSGFQAKVLDFGLAKIEGGVLGARGGRSLDITTIGSTVGTLAYMSPEQARGEVLDSRSDLFSVGVVLYEMATRQIPFPGATSALVFVKLLNEMPDPVRDWNDAIPKDLEKIIAKLMTKERSQRFQTAHQLYEALCKVGEKPISGGWRRLTSATPPNPRSTEAVQKERRIQKFRPSVMGDAPARVPDIAASPAALPSSDPGQVLRPVARVPNAPSRLSTSSPPASPAGVATLQPEPAKAAVVADSAAAAAISASVPLSATVLSATAAPAAEAAPSSVAGSVRIFSGRSQSGPAVALAEAPPVVSASVMRGVDRWPEARSPESTVDAAAPGVMEPVPYRATEIAPAIASDTFADSPADQRVAPSFTSVSKARWQVRPVWVLGGVVMLVVLGIAAVLIGNRGRFGRSMLATTDTVVLTEIENKTGNHLLDGTVAEALQIDLSESPYLSLRSADTYRTMRRQVAPEGSEMVREAVARNTALRLNTRAYLFGTLKGTAAPYSLHINLIDTASGDIMSSVESAVASAQDMPAVVDRLSDQLRTVAGEDGRSIERFHNPLSREATPNLAALQAYAEGEDASVAGRTLEALRGFNKAIELEPHFVQAHLQLITLYEAGRAELSAASEARTALAAATTSSERLRTLVQYEYEMNATGDFNRAVTLMRKVVADNPRDSDALVKLARVLRLQGHIAESLQAAQQSYGADPLNADAYLQAGNALLELDRYDAAFQLQEQAQRLGLGRPSSTLAAAYLEGRKDAVDAAVESFRVRTGGYSPDWTYGLYQDNVGHMAAGTQTWRKNSQVAGQVKGLESAAALLLSQGALDRALLGDCTGGLALMHQAAANPQGIGALFNNGMAAALCGSKADALAAMNELERSYPQSFNVNSFYIADIRGALALQTNDPATALEALQAARQFDSISLTPFLRGRAHVALRQGQLGILDYQTVLAHRGIAFTAGSSVYPVAEIGVARAFAATGDLNNSAEAYRRFLNLWKTADADQPLLTEARAHAK